MKTVEDYQKRDAHVIKYLKEQITKMEKTVKESMGVTGFEAKAKRNAYKDILFKMQTVDKPEPVSDREKTLLEMVDTDGTYTWTVEQFEEYLSLKDWSTATKMEHRLAFNGDITIEGNEIRYS